MAGNWRLLTSIVIGTVLAAAILSATAIYSDAIRDLGLDFAIEKEDIRDLDLVVLQSNIPVEAARYERAQARQSTKIFGVSDQSYTAVNRGARSATYFATKDDEVFIVGDSSFPRANFMWRSDLADHIQIIEGAWPIPQPTGSAQVVQVVIGEKTATAQGFSVGQELEVYPFWEKEPLAVPVLITGIAKTIDTTDRYWGQTNFVRLDGKERAWDTYLLWIPEVSAYGTLLDLSPTITADYRNTYQLEPERLNSRNSLLVSSGLDRLEPDLASTETRLTIRTDLPNLLRTYDQKLFFTRIPLLVLLLQVGGIVAYYLITVSTMLVDRQSAEIATLRSRGATTRQLLTQYAAEGGILAAIAIGLGPLVAATIISALGPTPAFSAISDGGRLEVHISMAAYVLACIGALIAFLALMVPAWRATRNTVVEYKKSQARPDKPPLFIRLYLDVAFMIVLALVYWRVSREGDLLAERFFGGQQELDPLLLATPAVFMVTVGVVFLRLFPPTLRLISWLVGWTRSVALLIGMRSLVRNPGNYSRLVLLLMFATGVGMFGATFSATLDRSYTERAEYAAGSSLRAVLSLANQAPGDTVVKEILEQKPEGEATLALRTRATLWRTSDNPREVEILGIDPSSFGTTAFFREDFAETSITDIVQDLDGDSVRLTGPMVPKDASQIGLWLKFENLAGRINVNTVLADGDGRLSHFAMGAVRPGDPATEDWMLFTADVTKPADKFGNAKVAPLPYSLRGLTFTASSRLTAQQASIRIGPLIYTETNTPPPAPEGIDDQPTTSGRFSWYFGLDGGPRGIAAWSDAATVYDFVEGGFSPLSGARAGSSGDFLSIDVDAPQGIQQTTTLSWV
ncbi:MAG: FtsX-like permease family protein, partial [Dehalococcoidia bacterium]|nr:FtsX-like permease family protein [Dehalococcoidia bacterium]